MHPPGTAHPTRCGVRAGRLRPALYAWLLACCLAGTLLVLVACASPPLPTPPLPTSPAGPPPSPTPVSAGALPPTPPLTMAEPPLARQGRVDYPGLLQVGKPADFDVQLFVAGQELPAQPSLTPVGRPVILPRHPDLQPYVAVSLDTLVNPQDIQFVSAHMLQPLSDVDNIWLWQITPSAKQNMTLQPILHVEYHDAANRVVPAYNLDLPLSESLTLTVVGPGAGDVAITVAERAGLPVAGLLLVGLLLLGGGARFPVNVNIRPTEIHQEVAAGGVANIGTLGNVQTGAGTQTNIAGPVQAEGDVYLGSTITTTPDDHPGPK